MFGAGRSCAGGDWEVLMSCERLGIDPSCFLSLGDDCLEGGRFVVRDREDLFVVVLNCGRGVL